MATQIGTTLAIAGQATISGYIVLADNRGGADMQSEDNFDFNGARTNRIIFQVDPKLNLELLAITGSTFSEFPEKAKCSVTTLSNYFVDSCTINRFKGATKATVSMTALGI